MAVMLKLSNVKCFVLKVNELRFSLPLTVYCGHEYIPKVIKGCEFYKLVDVVNIEWILSHPEG